MTLDTPMPDAPAEIISYPRLVIPGEVLSASLSQSIKLGPGLRHATSQSGETLIQTTQAGLLHRKRQTEFYIDYNSHRVLLETKLTNAVHP